MEDNRKETEQEVSVNSLASELLQEVKTQTKRWMIAFFVVVALWAATIGGFIWHLNQYDFASYDINSQDGGNANYIGNDGDILNGISEGENTQEEEP